VMDGVSRFAQALADEIRYPFIVLDQQDLHRSLAFMRHPEGIWAVL
jgi:hypothetical protein